MVRLFCFLIFDFLPIAFCACSDRDYPQFLDAGGLAHLPKQKLRVDLFLGSAGTKQVSNFFPCEVKSEKLGGRALY